METDWKIAQAKRAEEAAFATDPRIQNSEGASFDSHIGLARVREFARILRQLSHIELRAQRVAGGEAERHRWSAITGTHRARGVEA